MKFDVGETVICSVEIKDDTGAYKNPSNDTHHTKIKVTDKNGVVKVALTEMTNDSVGKYHYDCQTAGYIDGKFKVEYEATDGTRITIEKQTFELE